MARTVHISDIKHYVNQVDADVSIVKLGGCWRIVDNEGNCKVINNEEAVLAQLKADYPIEEVQRVDELIPSCGCGVENCMGHEFEDDFINDEELVVTGGK